VRDVIHRFNEIGLVCLDPRWAGGRPRLLSPDDEHFVVQTATTRPAKLGQPFTRWSIRKLLAYLHRVHGRVIRIGREALRCLLARRGVTFQRTKTWKESTDPEYDAKLHRIEHVLERFPDRTFAFDEFGPLGIRPTGGSCWAEQGRPDRLPATYKRTHGVTYFHGCYSVGDDTLWGVNRRRKGTANSLAALRSIRAARPDGAPVYVILDNLSAHNGKKILRWAKNNNVHLCFTPTNASWANPIEAHFGPLRQFTLTNSNHPNHTVQTRALHAYLRWRNANAPPPRCPRRPTPRTRPHLQRERTPLGRQTRPRRVIKRPANPMRSRARGEDEFVLDGRFVAWDRDGVAAASEADLAIEGLGPLVVLVHVEAHAGDLGLVELVGEGDRRVEEGAGQAGAALLRADEHTDQVGLVGVDRPTEDVPAAGPLDQHRHRSVPAAVRTLGDELLGDHGAPRAGCAPLPELVRLHGCVVVGVQEGDARDRVPQRVKAQLLDLLPVLSGYGSYHVVHVPIFGARGD
jgi:hypothetical protein